MRLRRLPWISFRRRHRFASGRRKRILVDGQEPELATEQGVSAGDIKVISAQSVNWPNGALGCPKPGVMYTQAIVPGYRVQLEAGGRRFTYHASTRGAVKRCEGRIQGLAPQATK